MTQNEKSKIRAKVIKWVTRLFLILVAIIMLYPLAWNVVSSFKTSTEFLTDPFAWPQGLAWDNYVRAYEKSNLAANIGNSIYVVLETLVIIVICVVPCSYCLVRYKFPGAKLILNIYMAAIFIQATYIMIPLFLQMNKLNLLNSLTALGVLYATMQFPFAIFLLTGFLRSIPRDYEEAAMIDGCNEVGIFFRIVMPLSRGMIAAVTLFIAVINWNDYYSYMMFIGNKTKLQPFAWVLHRMLTDKSLMNQVRNGAASLGFTLPPPMALRMATIICATLPIIIIYPFIQPYFTQGMTLGAVKE